MTINFHAGDLRVGDELAPWVRQTDLMSWNRFAAVNDEFIYMHMDDDAGHAAMNAAGAFGMGNLRFGYMLACVRERLGDEVPITEAGCRHTGLNQKGDVLTVSAVVDELDAADDGSQRVRLRIAVTNQDGVDISPGHVVAVLPSPEGG